MADNKQRYASTLNLLLLDAFVVREPEMKTLEGGKQLAEMTIGYANSVDGKPNYLRCTAWYNDSGAGVGAAVMGQKLKKGNRLQVKGHLDLDQSKGEDGKVRVYPRFTLISFNKFAQIEKSESTQSTNETEVESGFDPEAT